MDLFKSMSRYDQKHACRVARGLEDEGAPLELVRAGLLHDIGKAGCPELTLVRRSIAVWLEYAAPDEAELLATKGRGKLGRAVRTHKKHPEIGAARLTELGTDQHIVQLVRYHQSPDLPDDDDDLRWLRTIDERC